MSKTNKGITLVALIITIIILLILAVVAIRSITGDGILQKAREASDATTRGQVQEELDLALSNLKMEEVTRKNMSQQEKVEWLRQELSKQDGNATVVESGNGFIGNYKDHNFSVNEDYKVTIGDYAQNDNDNNDNIDNSQDGNEENTDNNNNGDNSLNEPQPDNSQQEDEGIFQENNTINGQPYSSTNPIIPAGFKPVDTDTSSWGDGTSAPDVDNGLVISDGNSEFVWVPVTTTILPYGLGTTNPREPDVITGVRPSSIVDSASGTNCDANASNLTLAGCTQDLNGDNIVNAYDFKKQLENEFEAMSTSIKKYGGFYVGRYEMSLKEDKTAQSKKNVESSNASKTDTYMWYGLYEKAKTYTNIKGSVKSTMTWAKQYYAMLTWLGTPAKTTIGNKRNTTRITGSIETDIIKNIYDLYGNSRECNLQAYESKWRTWSGGHYNGGITPSYEDSVGPTTIADSFGCRITLYVN